MRISNHPGRLALSHTQLETVIAQRTAELRILSQRLLKVQDEERRKLARDLHDSTGQTLAAIKIAVSFLQEKCKQDTGVSALVSEVALLADQALDEVRTMSYLLHPPLMDELGFTCAAEWFIAGFAKRSRITVRANFATASERLPMNTEIALFRVLQESLTNAHRHSGASEITVCFQRYPETAILEIRDFGRGIAAERLVRLREKSAAESGVGLAGMRERLNELNGKLEIESDGQGTTIRTTVPVIATSQWAGSRDSRHLVRLQTPFSQSQTSCAEV